jgi:8-oxo-dGTP pyrophosphatase MutT (NUDIX family)
METKLFVAAKAFIEHEGKVLVLCESGKYAEGTQEGKFDVVGGRIEAGKSLKENLLREIEEETGLRHNQVEVGNAFFANEAYPVVKGEQLQIIRIFFKCKSNTSEVKLSPDHDKFEWINPAEYKSTKVIENLHEVFEAYLSKNSCKNNEDSFEECCPYSKFNE